MPFDTIAARKTVNALQVRGLQPGGEVMAKAAEQLLEAINDTSGSMGQIRSAEASALEAKRKYDDLLLEMKAVRDKGPLHESAVATLRAIAVSKRGGNKIAAEWLGKNNLAVSTEFAAP